MSKPTKAEQIIDLENQIYDISSERDQLYSDVSELEAEIYKLESANQACFFAGRLSNCDPSKLRSWLKYKNEVGL